MNATPIRELDQNVGRVVTIQGTLACRKSRRGFYSLTIYDPTATVHAVVDFATAAHETIDVTRLAVPESLVTVTGMVEVDNRFSRVLRIQVQQIEIEREAARIRGPLALIAKYFSPRA